jgi:hypothetical protein
MLKKSSRPRITPARSADPYNSDECRLRFAPCLPEPERLVGLGFRYWMLGRQTGDISCWERTWSLYSGVFGLCGARRAVGTLSCWVNALNQTAHRDIEVFPESSRGFCRDECIAVSMIAACQHQTCPAMRACAFALVECSAIDRVVGEAQAFADTMAGLEQRLSAHSIVAAPAVVSPASQRLN